MIDIEAIEKAYQKAKVANETACIVINQEAFDFLTAASATWPQIRRELEAAKLLRDECQNLVATKGRHNTEIAYHRLTEALTQFDRSGT